MTSGATHSGARLLIASDNPLRAGTLVRTLAAAGHDCVTAQGTRPPQSADGLVGLDALILDGADPAQHLEAWRSSPGTAGVPCLLRLPSAIRSGISVDAADAVVPGQSPAWHMALRMAGLLRLQTMAREWQRRAAILERMGIAMGNPAEAIEAADEDGPALETGEDQVSILVLGQPGPDYAALEAALGGPKTVMIAAFSRDMAANYLREHSFDLVIINSDTDPEPFLPLAGSMRRNPALFWTPVLLIAPPNKAQELNRAFQAGVSDVLLKPFDDALLAARVRVLLREIRWHRYVHKALAAPLPVAATDGETGLFDPKILGAYLDAVLSDQFGRPRTASLTLLELHCDERGGLKDPALLRQAGEIIRKAVRVEDLTLRLEGPCLAIIMPETGEAAAGIALRRVAALLEAAEFDRPSGPPAKMWMSAAVAEVDRGEDGAQLLKRAYGLLRGSTVAA